MQPFKINKSLDNVEGGSIIFSAAIIAVMMVLTTIDVILRYIFNSPLPGVYTLCELMIVGAVYPALAYIQRQKGHVRVDILIDHLSGKWRIVFEIAVLLMAIISFSLVGWRSGKMAIDAWITGDHATGLIEYPYWPAKAAMTFGIVLLLVRLIRDMITYILELRKTYGRWPVLFFYASIPLIMVIFLIGFLESKHIAPMTIGTIMLFSMVVILFMGIPVSFGLLLTGIMGYWILGGGTRTLMIVGGVPFEKIASYTLSVIPLFILMGHLAYQSGFAASLYGTAQKWIGHIPGSMAQATVLGGAVFGAACGSGLASCATLAKICIPVMKKYGVDEKMGVGCVAAVGGLAQMIPPSILMVIYAVITDQSVGKLLIAGIIPGIIAAICFIGLIYIRVKLKPELAPISLKDISWSERLKALKGIWGIAIIGIIVMGGIYTGVFTPTEAGALGAFSTLFIGVITKRLNITNFKEALMESTKTTGMIFLIIATAMVFGYFIGISRIPAEVSDLLIGLEMPRHIILIGILIMFIIAGMFIDMLAFLFLTLPIIYPSIISLGYDPLWFGVIIVFMCELALITPPFGLNLFVLRGMLPEMDMKKIIWGTLPFMVTDLFILVLYVVFPNLATWLPSYMR